MCHRIIFVVVLCACSSEFACAEDPILSPLTRRLQSVLLNASEEEKASEPKVPPSFPVVIWVHESAFQANSDNKVDIVSPVDTVIVGTRAVGAGRTTGTIKVACDPSPDSSAIVVSFTGQTHSKTVGRNGPARIHSQSSTRFTASRKILLSAEEGLQCQKTNLQSKTTLTITDIQPSRGGLRGALIRRVGWRRAAGVQSRAEQEAAANARREIAASFDRALNERVASINKQLEVARMVYSLRRKPSELTVQVRSCEGYLRFALMPKGTKAIADVDLPVPNSSLEVWMHQSELGDPGVQLPEPIAKLANATNSLAANLPAIQTLFRPTIDDGSFGVRSENGWLIASFGRQAISGKSASSYVARKPAN
jgi:hypothetical protein